MDAAFVSVIIPAYNAARFIERTLDSALWQTHRALEVIVVDDGSTDETCAIVERIARTDSRVVLVRQPNGGVSRARNTGLALARGDHVAPLDADDLWHPTKLAKQLRCLAAAPRAGVVYCHFSVIDEEDGVVLPRRLYHTPTGHVYPQLTVGNIVGNASAPLVQRALLVEIGGYDEAFREGCEDLDAYLRLAERSEYALVPEFLVGYRRSRDSMSMNIAKMERAVAQLTRKMLDRHPRLPRRLLRWRDGNMYRYLALHALMGSHRRTGVVLAAKSLLADPLLLAGWVLARLAGTRRGAAQLEASGRPDFYATDPVPGPGERFEPTRLDARRHAAAARIRIDHLAA